MSQCIKSKGALDDIEVDGEKLSRVCFAKGQISQTLLGSQIISGILFESN